MTYNEKEKISEKISLVIAEALEANKITMEKAGLLAQACLKQMDATDSMEKFKMSLENEYDPKLTSLIYEIFGDFKN